MHLPIPPDQLVRQFGAPPIRALVLMGSYARDTAGPFSDLDLVRFVDETPPPLQGTGTHLLAGHLVVVSEVRPAQVERWFTEPEEAVDVIAGLRTARALLDRANTFKTLQVRAQTFVWSAALQQRANHWASQQLVGWIEEVHKGLEGLRRQDVGRLLNARYGCSWGLSRVLQVQRGVLLTGDNAFYDDVAAAVGVHSTWVALRRIAFGIEGPDGTAVPLRAQVRAGLQLYVETATLLASVLAPADAPLIAETVRLIMATLAAESA